MKLDDDLCRGDLVKVISSTKDFKEGKEYRVYFTPLKVHSNVALGNKNENKKGWFLIDKKFVEKVS